MTTRKHFKRCVDCNRNEAVTNDGKLCLGCLRKRIDEMNPPDSGRSRFPSSMRGERARNSTTLGGQAEMLHDGDDE